MGGDCIGSDLVYLSTGYDFMGMVIDVACGKEPVLAPKREPVQAEIHFLFTLEDVEEMRRFQTERPEEIYRISEPGSVKCGSCDGQFHKNRILILL